MDILDKILLTGLIVFVVSLVGVKLIPLRYEKILTTLVLTLLLSSGIMLLSLLVMIWR